MITANDAKQLVGYEKAQKFISKKIKNAALAGEHEYVYTTNMKAKANRLVKQLKKVGYNVRFVHTPSQKREHKIIVNW